MEKRVPKHKTFDKWKTVYSWLHISDNKLTCNVCKSQKEKIRFMPGVSMSFISGSTNYKPSTLSGHEKTEHIKEAAHEASGSSLQPEKVLRVMPENAPLGNKERDGLIKLHKIVYFIALKGNPFTDFKS